MTAKSKESEDTYMDKLRAEKGITKPLRHFLVFYTERATRCYGNVRFEVWGIKQNKPVYIGEGSYNTGGTKGLESEAFDVIHKNCDWVPKWLYTTYNGYYRWDNGYFKIQTAKL